jgi:hypothetical protein
MDAIELVMEQGYAVTAFVCLILNLIIPEEIEDEEVPELTADLNDVAKDEAEWGRLHSVAHPRKKSHDNAAEPTEAHNLDSEDHSATNGHDIEKAEP